MMKNKNKIKRIIYGLVIIGIFCLSGLFSTLHADVTINNQVPGSGMINPNVTPNDKVPGSGMVIPPSGTTPSALGSPTSPVTGSGGAYTNQEKIPGASQVQSEFIPYLKDIINFGFAIIGILALFMLIIGAYQYLMAAGGGKAEGAKETISSALLGLVLGLTAWVILNKINPDLVNMNPISTISGGGATSGIGAPGATPIPTSYTSNAPAEIQQKAKDYAAKNNVPEAIAMKMLSMESGGVVGAVSPKGASGLLQLMPGTARGLGVTDIFNVDQNLNAGYKYANQMYQQYGDWGKAMAAYNMGPNAFNNYMAGNQGMSKETINYVNKITGSCSFCPKT